MRAVLASVLFMLVMNASAQVTLSFNPEIGTKYEYYTEITQSVRTTVMGQEIMAEIMTGTMFLMEISDKSEQETTALFTFNEISYVVSSLYMKMVYDSKNPNENQSDIDLMLSKMFNEMLGKSFTALIASDGSVKSISGMEAIGKSMSNAVANDGQMIAQLGAQMKEQFNDTAMKNILETSFKIYPTTPVRTGNSWDIENSTTINNLKVVYRSKYTLRSVSRNIATVVVDSKIEMNTDSGATEAGDMSGSQKGTMTIDTRTGMPVTSEMSGNLQGVIRAAGMDAQMVVETKSKSSLKIVE